jgi:flagellar basal body L-ring protein FlgH
LGGIELLFLHYISTWRERERERERERDLQRIPQSKERPASKAQTKRREYLESQLLHDRRLSKLKTLLYIFIIINRNAYHARTSRKFRANLRKPSRLMMKFNESVWLSQLEFPTEVKKKEDRENNERKMRKV